MCFYSHRMAMFDDGQVEKEIYYNKNLVKMLSISCYYNNIIIFLKP